MNRTLNQLINQLHLDPKKEAAVRKIVYTAISNNQSGGSNSGGYTDMMVLNTSDNAVLTEEQFNEIEERVKNGYLFELQYDEPDGTTTYYSQGIKYRLDSNNCWYIFNGNFSVATKDVSYSGDVIFIALKQPNGYAFVGMPVNDLPNSELAFPILKTPKFYYNGDGTKFLSDDGTYKEVSGGSGPVIIELSIGEESFESAQLTDQQIEACKNSNIKIKLNFPDYAIILVPYFYEIRNETILLYIRNVNHSSVVVDATFIIDINNKIIEYTG